MTAQPLDREALDRVDECVARHGQNACPVSDETMRKLSAQARAALDLEARVAELEHRFTMTNVANGVVEQQHARRVAELERQAFEAANLHRDQVLRVTAAAEANVREAREAVAAAADKLDEVARAFMRGKSCAHAFGAPCVACDAQATIHAARAFLARPASDDALRAALAAERERVAGILHAQGDAIVVHGQDLYEVGSKALAYHYGARDEWRAAAKFVRALGDATNGATEGETS